MVTACYRLLFSLSTEKWQFARLIFGYLINNVYLCASIEKKIVMTDQKEQTILELAMDQKAQEMLESICYHWEEVQNRMVQIGVERTDGIIDDLAIEAMPLFFRMKRIYTHLFQLMQCPQALLLPSFAERLLPLIEDKRMDPVVVLLMFEKQDVANEGQVADFWQTLEEYQPEVADTSSFVQTWTATLFMKYIMPHLNPNDMFAIMTNMSEMMPAIGQPTEMAKTGLPQLGPKIKEVVDGNRVQMGVGMMLGHLFMDMTCKKLDMKQQSDSYISEVFELAKKQLMESDAWHAYWENHKRHLEQLGDLDEQFKEDAKEVEEKLVNMHGYLYTKWNESPETFGQTLKQAGLSDEQMLQLLFYLAKKDAIALVTEKPDDRRQRMEDNVMKTALKLQELVDEDYLLDYEDIWWKIVKSEHLSQMLMDYNSSKYNNGFYMMCFCKIVGYLHREHHFYGNHSPEDMGKVLGDRYVKNSYETFSKYIKKKESMLNDLCFNELENILKKK